MSEKQLNAQWLGPFLCKPTMNSMGFWISQGREKSKAVIKIKVWSTSADHFESTIELSLQGNIYGVSIGEVINLSPDSKYQYEVLVDDVALSIDGLTKEDMTFYTLPHHGDDIEMVMMSCHGVEAYEQDPDKDRTQAWKMWEKLETVLKQSPDCRIGILGGDQVYMDYTFGEDLQNFDPLLTDKTQLDIYRTYHYYWNHSAYRKVMARLPCLLMWDDHDIIDGWGSREDAYHKSTKKTWELFGKHLFSAYDEMQSIRNPKGTIEGDCRSYYFEWGHLGILGLDLRSNRCKISENERQMLAPNQRKEIEKRIGQISDDIKTVFVVSPVTLTRMGGKIETFLGGLSDFLWNLGAALSYGKSIKRVIFWSFIFTIYYSVSYMETKAAPGIVQTVSAFLTVSILAILNIKAIKRYFPNKGALILKVAGAVSLILLGFVCFQFWRLSQLSDWSSGLLADVWQASASSMTDNIIGLILSLSAIFTLGLSTSKTIKTKMVKSKIGKLLSQLSMSIFATCFFLVSIFNWWRGLPGVETSLLNLALLFPYVVFALITLCFFVMCLLEVSGAVDAISSLNDDIEDSWSAHSHKVEMNWLVDAMATISNGGKRKVVVLSGDIHTAGLSELNLQDCKDQFRVVQITSSPMSYVTMPHLVEKLTSGNSAMPVLGADGKIGTARNIFYRSERNFVILRVSKKTGDLVSYYFEDLDVPLAFVLK